jgi:2-hydroxychromene-2-carboxylate isomerase
MTLTYDLFWSFRSPYSYLLASRLLEFERDYDVRANVRPVYPIAVRIDGFFKKVNPLGGAICAAMWRARRRCWTCHIHRRTPIRS